MKNRILFYVLALLMLASCSSKTFYQIYKVIPDEKIKPSNDKLVFEDENCKVIYNLWSDGGNAGFLFFNKTDKNLYLNLEESFFVKNSISYNYYRNRVFTYSESVGLAQNKGLRASTSITGFNSLDLLQTNSFSLLVSENAMLSTGSSTSYAEEKIKCLPPQSAKYIKEYDINQTIFRDCNLFLYPRKKQIKKIAFNKENSPLVFSNYISYRVGQNDEFINIRNDFFVSELSNLPKSEVVKYQYEENCGEKSTFMTETFKHQAPNEFYIKYSGVRDHGSY